MAGFFYRVAAPEQDLVRRGHLDLDYLEHVGLLPVFWPAAKVPDDVVVQALDSGTMLYPKAPGRVLPRSFTFSEKKQQWINYGPYSVGWNLDDPPDPESLQLQKVPYSGYVMEDSSGGRWTVPIIRSPDHDHCGIPGNLMFRHGETDPEFVVKERYRQLWDETAEVCDFLRGGEQKTLRGRMDTALRILQVNYRLVEGSVNALNQIGSELFDEERVLHILMFGCDWFTVVNYAENSKKNEGQDSGVKQSEASHGQEEEKSPAIDLAVAT